MKEILDFQQTRDTLSYIQSIENKYTYTLNDLHHKYFIYYVLIKHDSSQPKLSSELIVNYIINIQNSFIINQSIRLAMESTLKELLGYYEQNNHQIKVDKYNVDLMQTYVDKLNQLIDDNTKLIREHNEIKHHHSSNDQSYNNSGCLLFIGLFIGIGVLAYILIMISN